MLSKSIFYCVAGLSLVFFPCEVGQRLTNAFDETNYKFEQLQWYLFPVKIQRMLPTILSIVQTPMVLEWFGIVSGTRDQFKKVINKLNQCHSYMHIIYFDYCKPIRWSILCTKASISCEKCTTKIVFKIYFQYFWQCIGQDAIKNSKLLLKN